MVTIALEELVIHILLLGIFEKKEFSLLSLDDLALPIPLEVGLKFCR